MQATVISSDSVVLRSNERADGALRLAEEPDGEVGAGQDYEVIARRRDSEVPMGCKGRQAFRWRRAMDRVDGEYIMI